MADGDPRATPGPVDYDLHGLVGVRVIDGSPRDVAAVDRQLGPIRGALGRPPDITIRFVDRLAIKGRERLLGAGDASFSDDAFMVLRAKFKARARVAIALDRIGSGVEFVCERGLPAVPFLIPILNLTALAGGALPLHACAFEHRGLGAVVTGWSKGGKTESLLAFVSRGARYIGDEWVYIEPDAERVHGIPEPIRLWDWHLAQLPAYRRLVGAATMARLASLRAGTAAGRVVRRGLPGGSRAARLLDRTLPLVEAQRHVDVPPEVIFGAELGRLGGAFDRLFFVMSTTDEAIHVEPMDPLEAARRMVFSLQYERLDFTALYDRFCFAFPGARSEAVETAAERERTLLERAFKDRPTYRVEHPYPVSLEGLFRAMDERFR